MNINLKQPPKIENPESLQGQYAGFISRLIAFIIDFLIVVMTVAVAGWFTSLLINFFGLSEFFSNLEASTSMSGNLFRALTAFWGVTTISFLYFVLAWTVTSGKTIGKGLLGLRIVPLDGTRISLLESILRYIAFWFSVICLGIGIFWILVSDKRQGWHDKAAKTCVIYDWPAREDIFTSEHIQRRMNYLFHTRKMLRSRHSSQNDN